MYGSYRGKMNNEICEIVPEGFTIIDIINNKNNVLTKLKKVYGEEEIKLTIVENTVAIEYTIKLK